MAEKLLVILDESCSQADKDGIDALIHANDGKWGLEVGRGLIVEAKNSAALTTVLKQSPYAKKTYSMTEELPEDGSKLPIKITDGGLPYSEIRHAWNSYRSFPDEIPPPSAEEVAQMEAYGKDMPKNADVIK